MRTAYCTVCSGGMAAASQAGRELLLLRCGNTRLGARHREKGSAGIHTEGRIQVLFLGALQCCPGALHVDFLGALGAIGEHTDMFFEYLQKPLMALEIPLLALVCGQIGYERDADQRWKQRLCSR